VPKPPGKSATALASFTRKSFRVKKYLKVMSFGSAAIQGFYWLIVLTVVGLAATGIAWLWVGAELRDKSRGSNQTDRG